MQTGENMNIPDMGKSKLQPIFWKSFQEQQIQEEAMKQIKY